MHIALIKIYHLGIFQCYGYVKYNKQGDGIGFLDGADFLMKIAAKYILLGLRMRPGPMIGQSFVFMQTPLVFL